MDSNAPNSVGNDGPSAVERATQMRASLGARRDVESMLAEAAQLRQQAAADADATVEEALQISQALVAESKQQAEGILARARTEAATTAQQAEAAAEQVRLEGERRADEHRAQVEADVAERARRDLAQVRQQSQSLIADAEDAVRGLGGTLDQASARIATLLQTLGALRTSAVDALPAATDDDLARPTSGDDAPSYTASAPAVPAVAAQAPAFDVSEPVQERAEVPEPSVASFMHVEPTDTEPTKDTGATEPAEPAQVPEPSVASFAEVPRAEVPDAVAGFTPFSAFAQEAQDAEGHTTREVPAVPARLETDHSSIFAAARDEQDHDLSQARAETAEEPGRGVFAPAAEQETQIGADLRDQGPALRRAGDREDEEAFEVVPAEQEPVDPEPASRPLGWLFRSAQ